MTSARPTTPPRFAPAGSTQLSGARRGPSPVAGGPADVAGAWLAEPGVADCALDEPSELFALSPTGARPVARAPTVQSVTSGVTNRWARSVARASRGPQAVSASVARGCVVEADRLGSELGDRGLDLGPGTGGDEQLLDAPRSPRRRGRAARPGRAPRPRRRWRWRRRWPAAAWASPRAGRRRPACRCAARRRTCRACRRGAGRPRRAARRRPTASGRQLVEAAGEGGADVQRPLDRVLAGLVAGDAAGGGEVGAAPRGAEDVEVLAHVQLDLQLVPDGPKAAGGARASARSA